MCVHELFSLLLFSIAMQYIIEVYTFQHWYMMYVRGEREMQIHRKNIRHVRHLQSRHTLARRIITLLVDSIYCICPSRYQGMKRRKKCIRRQEYKAQDDEWDCWRNNFFWHHTLYSRLIGTGLSFTFRYNRIIIKGK
jgi:hypothetical protein